MATKDSILLKIAESVLVVDEGGWVATNHNTDLGGLTVAGMALKYQTAEDAQFLMTMVPPGFSTGKADMVNLTAENKQRVIALYAANYFDKEIGPHIPLMALPCYFSMCVNLGIEGAQKAWQKVHELTPDGVIGPKSKEVLADYKTDEPTRDWLMAHLIDRWAEEYLDRVAKNPGQSVNLRGWIRRVARYAGVDACYACDVMGLPNYAVDFDEWLPSS